MQTSSTAAQVAQTILSQLGGSKFIAMTGSKNFGAGTNDNGNDYLSMHLTRNKAKAKYLTITLNANDTYTMLFRKTVNKYDLVTVATYENVYCDMLQDIFTEVTGLYTSLGTMAH